MNIATFRQRFPEFSSEINYPDAQIQFWLDYSLVLLPADRWQDQIEYGTGLLTAHHLVIGRKNQLAADAGGVGGGVTGVQTSKSVDKVSASYDAGAVTIEGAGFWNMSSYGIQFYQLAQMIGAGGIQL